jgi:hypothetical protein
MAITLSNGLITELKTTTQATNLQFGDLVGKIQIGLTAGNNSGIGAWYFYSDEGNINIGPPVADGNAIFLLPGSPNVETYNPNKQTGIFMNFNLKDSTGTDYTPQFEALVNNGGSISITQGANTVTYTSTTPGTFAINDIEAGAFFVISTTPATQTTVSNNSFVFADPISIIFG